MKIEKLTENKIQIILKKTDFKDKEININQLLLTTTESQKLFLEILNRAEKELNFDTTGHKLLIDAIIENDDIFTFTITKYLEKELNKKNTSKKIISLAKKNKTFNASSLIYEFNCFEDFCDFCDYIHNAKNMNINGLYKHSILYLYNSTYYLSIDDLNFSDQQSIAFHSSLLEFSSLAKYTKNFKFKLKEHGKVIMKNNAIRTGIRYFS